MDALRINDYAASVHACHEKSLIIIIVQLYVGSREFYDAGVNLDIYEKIAKIPFSFGGVA